MKDFDLTRHDVIGCAECSRRHYIVDDVRRGIEVLKALSLPAEGDLEPSTVEHAATVPEHVSLSVELDDIEEKLGEYIAHLVRTKSQAGFKRAVMKHLKPEEFYVLVDYWAKLTPTKSMNATCEGTQSGISCHGAMFIYRNPSMTRRKQLANDFGTVIGEDDASFSEYWAGFPPPPEADGPEFVTEHFHALSNDSNQNHFHTMSVMHATLQNFVKDRPWLNTPRGGYCQSDQAGNYRDPTTEIFLELIGNRCFTEANEGKDEGDAEAGRRKRGIQQYRDRGNDTEDQEDFLAALRDTAEEGGVHGILVVDRDQEDTVPQSRRPVPHISNYALWKVTPDDKIIFWESLDLGRAWEKGEFQGYGTGIVISLADFNEHHRTQARHPGASFNVHHEDATKTPSPKPRFSQEQAKAAAAIAQEEKCELVRKKLQALEEEQALLDSLEPETKHVLQCHTCGKAYTTSGWFSRHIATGSCLSRAEKNCRAHQKRSVRALLHGAWREQQDCAEADAAALTTVRSLGSDGRGYPDFAAISQSFAFADSLEVSQVSPLSSAHLEAAVSVGFRLVGVSALPQPANKDGLPTTTAVTNLGELQSACDHIVSKGGRIELRFVRQLLPIPNHGAARKGLHQRARTALLPEQVEWLKMKVFHNGLRRMRDIEAFRLMQIDFQNKVHPETGKHLWLSQDQIRAWISRYWGELKKGARESGKQAAVQAAIESAAAEEGEVESALHLAAFPHGDEEQETWGT